MQAYRKDTKYRRTLALARIDPPSKIGITLAERRSRLSYL
jgi:hypothetical protein